MQIYTGSSEGIGWINSGHQMTSIFVISRALRRAIISAKSCQSISAVHLVFLFVISVLDL